MEDAKSDAAAANREETVVNKERFVRWQRLAIDQLGFTLNFILTLTIAALGYIFALLKDKEFIPTPYAQYSLILSLLALAIAAICGMACTINRLRDVQGTARRLRESVGAPSSRELRIMGKRTWKFFYTQLVTFSLGIVFLGTALLLTYGGKLGTTKQNGANPSSNYAKNDVSNSLPNGMDTSRPAQSNDDIEIQRQLATFTKYLVWVGAAQALILFGTLFLIWRQATLMKTHADHFDKLARATASQVNLMEAQFDQWIVITDWRTWNQPRNNILRITADLVNPTGFPITLSDGYLSLVRYGVPTQSTKYLLAVDTFLSPKLPKAIDFDVNLTEAEQAGNVRFQVIGVFSHFHRISKRLITQPIEGTLECSRWKVDARWHAIFSPSVQMNPETEAHQQDQANEG